MAITKSKSLLELSLQSEQAGTNTAVKAALDIDTDLSSSLAPIQANIATISGAVYVLDGEMNTAQADIISHTNRITVEEAATVAMSGDIQSNTAEIYNVDLSLTNAILNTFTLAVSAGAGPSAYARVTIQGTNYIIPLYPE